MTFLLNLIPFSWDYLFSDAMTMIAMSKLNWKIQKYQKMFVRFMMVYDDIMPMDKIHADAGLLSDSMNKSIYARSHHTQSESHWIEILFYSGSSNILTTQPTIGWCFWFSWHKYVKCPKFKFKFNAKWKNDISRYKLWTEIEID